MLSSGVLALTGSAIGVAAVVSAGLIAGVLAWLSIPLWLLTLAAPLHKNRHQHQEVCDDVIRPHP